MRIREHALLLLSAIALLLGTARLNAEELPKVGETADDFELKTLAGDDVKLSKLSAQGPVVVVVLRGFPGYQCPLCTRQVAEILKSADAFEKSKAHVVLIYPGPPEKLTDRAKEFIGKTKLPDHFKFVTDPGYSFTNDWSLRWDAKRETAYPSVFVVDQKRKVHFAHISKSHGNRAKTKDVLAALKKLN